MLRGPHITLRTMRADDLHPLVSLMNDVGEAGAFGDIRLRSEAALRRQFDEDGWWGERQGLLLLTHEERIIGEIVFFEGFRHEDGFEVGYEIFSQADRGRGWGTEALRIFSAYLFALKPIARLHVSMRADNAASRRIAEKCGYVLEGTFRRFSFERGRHHDTIVLALLREDCLTLEEALTAR